MMSIMVAPTEKEKGTGEKSGYVRGIYCDVRKGDIMRSPNTEISKLENVFFTIGLINFLPGILF